MNEVMMLLGGRWEQRTAFINSGTRNDYIASFGKSASDVNLLCSIENAVASCCANLFCKIESKPALGMCCEAASSFCDNKAPSAVH